MAPTADPTILQLAVPWIVAQVDVRAARVRGDTCALSDAVVNAATLRERFHLEVRTNSAMERLTRLGLTDTEMAVLLTVAVAEVRPDVANQLGEIGGASRVSTIEAFVYGDQPSRARYEETSSRGTLGRRSIIKGLGDPSAPPLRVCPRVMRLLLGDDSPSTGAWRTARGLAAHQLAAAADTAMAVGDALKLEGNIVILKGVLGSGRRSTLEAIGQAQGRDVLALAMDDVPFDRCVRLLHELALECRLTGKIPLLCNLDALADDKGERLAIVANEFAPLIEGTILVTCGVQRPAVKWDRPVIVIEMGQPTHAQRAKLWLDALGCGTSEDADRLANHYPLAPALIVKAAEAANARAVGRAMVAEDIHAGVRAVLDDKLGSYARRISVTQTWDDIVLPADQTDAIIELMARVRGRHKVYEQWGFGAKVGKGLGVSALFSGPPGTGKTMVAGLIAKELGLELYQVDMAKIASKYIGETENNLAALFDAAEAGHAILLFDEADSLFGKRTEVKSSNDRYANLETNYLLQRLESFTGICLLTSNHESNMDPAFQRRLSLHLRFDLPDADERAQLWRAVLPEGAPIAKDIDFAGLARRFAMSGGYIKNAALRAAFLAADRDEAITSVLLEKAARVEYEGMGKLAA